MPDIKFSNKYPYTDFHELNLDWVIKEVKYWSEKVGKTIQSIDLTGTVGLVDTYTITYSDGTTSTFDVTNGNGITSVAKTGTAGLVDTYTITFQDGSTTTFEVHNGTASIDNTLTRSGWAADAEAVGVELSPDPIASFAPDLTIIPDSQVTSSTGVISSYPGRSRNDYTDLKDCGIFNLAGNNIYNYCLYDKDYIYITGASGNVTGDHARPSNAKYIIFTCLSDDVLSAVITLKNVPSTVGKIYDKLEEQAGSADAFSVKYVTDQTMLRNVIGVTKQPGNLINCAECVDNVYINFNAGDEISNNGYFATGFLPVTPGTTYRSNVGRNHAFYKADKTYLSGASGTSIQTGITAPANAAYIRYTINKTTDGMTDPFELYFAELSVFDDSVVIPKLQINYVNPWCYGLKINWIGDSIVDGYDFDEEVCAALGLIKQSEYGINGSTIALAADGTDGRTALCLRYTAMSDDADLIAVSCGTNDWMYAWCPIGDINSTQNNTFYGALKTLCEGLINKYPDKLIFFTTPIKRAQSFANGDGGTYTADGVMTTPFSKNKYGLTLGEYSEIIKEVCGYYSIPVLDMYNESLLNPHIPSQQSLFDAALTHPNTAGQKIMARRVAGWITQLGYNIS